MMMNYSLGEEKGSGKERGEREGWSREGESSRVLAERSWWMTETEPDDWMEDFWLEKESIQKYSVLKADVAAPDICSSMEEECRE